MSVSLVKKSLDLVSTEDRSSEKLPKKKVEKNSKSIRKAKHTDSKKNAIAAVEKIRQKSKKDKEQDKVEANVQKLLNLSKAETIHKKLETKLLSKVTNTKKECQKSEPQSIFTEEDFAKFEREYFVDGCY